VDAATAAGIPRISYRSLYQFRQQFSRRTLPDLGPQGGPPGLDRRLWAEAWLRVGDRDASPVVLGRPVAYHLTDKQAALICALLDAGPDGMTEAALRNKAECGGVRATFNRLREKHPDLASVLHRPEGRLGFRVGPPQTDSIRKMNAS
jgi:hypothetical protein